MDDITKANIESEILAAQDKIDSANECLERAVGYLRSEPIEDGTPDPQPQVTVGPVMAVRHGDDAYAERPDAVVVHWYGKVFPYNAQEGDVCYRKQAVYTLMGSLWRVISWLRDFDSMPNPGPSPEPDPTPDPDPTPEPEPEPEQGEFVRVEDGKFMLGDEEFRFSGTNQYHLATYEKQDPRVTDRELALAKDAGVNVIRTWAFYDGPPQHNGDPSFQPEPGVYNEDDLIFLDSAVAKAKASGIKLILSLMNRLPQLGGVPAYRQWFGFGNHFEDFMNHQQAQDTFKAWISYLLNRVNTITGVAYKDEPAIMAWQIINEARNRGRNPEVLRDWYQGIAQHIKSIDSNHLVSTGEEGFDDGRFGSWASGGVFDADHYQGRRYSNTYPIASGEGTSFWLNTQIPEIDFAGCHSYPMLWLNKRNVAEFGDGEDVREFIRAWIEDHKAIAKEFGKPLLVGEYGLHNVGLEQLVDIYPLYWQVFEENDANPLLWQLVNPNPKGTENEGNISVSFDDYGNVVGVRGEAEAHLYLQFVDHIKRIKDAANTTN